MLKIAHNMPPRCSKTTLRRLQVAKGPPEEAPERQNAFKHLQKMDVCCLLAFFASDGLLRPQNGSDMDQANPKRAHDSPRSAHECPNSARLEEYGQNNSGRFEVRLLQCGRPQRREEEDACS